MDLLSETFSALADPTRRAILARLARGDATVGELAQPFPISGPAISRHLRVLERAGLIHREVAAQWRLCRLQTPPLQAAHDWLDHYRMFWELGLDRLVELTEDRLPDAPQREITRTVGTRAVSKPVTSLRGRRSKKGPSR